MRRDPYCKFKIDRSHEPQNQPGKLLAALVFFTIAVLAAIELVCSCTGRM